METDTASTQLKDALPEEVPVDVYAKTLDEILRAEAELMGEEPEVFRPLMNRQERRAQERRNKKAAKRDNQ